MLETEGLMNAHPIDDIFLIDMSEAEIVLEDLEFGIGRMTTNTRARMVKTLLRVIRRLRIRIYWASILFTVLIHAFYATIPRISLKHAVDRRRLDGISDIRTLNTCSNSDQVMKHMLVHITTQSYFNSGMDRRYTMNNVLLCGLLSNHISTVLARKYSGRRHILQLRVLNYGIQRLEYEFGDAARLFHKLNGVINYDRRREDLGPPWPLLEEDDDYYWSKYLYEDFCFRMLCHASFDEYAGTAGDIASHGARNIASHDSLNVQYLVRHILFSTVITQDYSVLYASGGDISCLETESVTVLRQNSRRGFMGMRKILHKHIRVKLDGEPISTGLKNLRSHLFTCRSY